MLNQIQNQGYKPRYKRKEYGTFDIEKEMLGQAEQPILQPTPTSPLAQALAQARLAKPMAQSSPTAGLGAYNSFAKYGIRDLVWEEANYNALLRELGATHGGGIRTKEQQAQLKKTKPGLAAAPGHSWHEVPLIPGTNFSIAKDIKYGKKLSDDVIDAILAKYGYWRPMGPNTKSKKKEPWHIERIVTQHHKRREFN